MNCILHAMSLNDTFRKAFFSTTHDHHHNNYNNHNHNHSSVILPI